MVKKVSNKTLLYTFDPDENYTYNVAHENIEYPYNNFPKGANGRVYKKTRFNSWEPKQEDIIMRHYCSQIHINFSAVFDEEDVVDPNIQLFQLRSKRLELYNVICEQINFFTALYDDDNELITSMLIAKYKTDSQTYTLNTFDEYAKDLHETLFSKTIMEKIYKMVDENDVGDDIIGLFSKDFLRDMFVVTFMIKILHVFIEHFIMSVGGVPQDLYELYAKAFHYCMDNINKNMYVILYNYVQKNVQQ